MRYPAESGRRTRLRDRQRLRERLVEMRDDTLDRMERRGAVEPGFLTLLAGIAATLEALDRRG